MSGDQSITLTQAELRAIVREAVVDTLMLMGVDAENPIEMQKDFQHLREWRGTVEAVKRRSLLTVAGILATGLVAAVWVGIKSGLVMKGL